MEKYLVFRWLVLFVCLLLLYLMGISQIRPVLPQKNPNPRGRKNSTPYKDEGITKVISRSLSKSRGIFSKYIPNVDYTSIRNPEPMSDYSRGNFKPPGSRGFKTILLYTSFAGDANWGIANIPEHMEKASCRIRECRITKDKNEINTADVVVFSDRDSLNENLLRSLSSKRPAYQMWVWHALESTGYYQSNPAYNNFFNWTMTYHRDSHIHCPYYFYTRVTIADKLPSPSLNFALHKKKKVAWIVSNCGKIRESYVLELQHYVDITVYGGCGSRYTNNGGSISRSESLHKVIRNYKFYLAFENTFCEDYITEKYHRNGLLYGVVPIVMGGNYNKTNSIPGSYIDVSDFPSIKELGDYINYLDTRDEEYNRYFEWKQHFKPTEPDRMCLMCNAAHDLSRAPSIVKDIDRWWSAKRMCEPYENIIRKLQYQVDASKANRTHPHGA